MPPAVAAETSATGRQKPPSPSQNAALRRRMNGLAKGTSLSTLHTATVSAGSKEQVGRRTNDDLSPSSPDNDGPQTEPSDPEDEPRPILISDREQPSPAVEVKSSHTLPRPNSRHSLSRQKPKPQVDTAYLEHRNSVRFSEPLTPVSRSWYKFDLAVVVALVSPIGNWLTGGDYIKNLILVAFLIFYLHQIIEVPWALYQGARPRWHPPHLPSPRVSELEQRYHKAATSELYLIEVFCLFLTTLSPFLGAMLLRFVSTTVVGPESISWFSVGLFILAAGMRPWSHLVTRLTQRTTALHDVVHYPPSPHALSEREREKDRDMLLAKISEMAKKIEDMEKSHNKLKLRFGTELDDLYEQVEGDVENLARAIRKHDKAIEKADGRSKIVEDELQVMKSSRVRGFPFLSAAAISDRDPLRAAKSRPNLFADAGPNVQLAKNNYGTATTSLIGSVLPAWLFSRSASPRHKELYRVSHSRYSSGERGSGAATPVAPRGHSSSGRSSSVPPIPTSPSTRADEVYLTPPADSIQMRERGRDRSRSRRAASPVLYEGLDVFNDADVAGGSGNHVMRRNLNIGFLSRSSSMMKELVYSMVYVAFFPITLMWGLVFRAH
ncbi:hypothetical protein BDN72DRAFT_903522 [Pluteus cervinus]|uniref:Uncharacterized protein n=1 Tax=Pluteus cervinus TaxID=181527 RepID=A0ACD3A9K8_9AGAR|nr:hypothetical protein BDN72DRAFT_903522 [Pluteus cervinus]